MVHCPECGSSFDAIADVTFEDVDARIGFVRAAKRFYTVSCADCGAAIGSGVAGARGNAGAAGADAGGA